MFCHVMPNWLLLQPLSDFSPLSLGKHDQGGSVQVLLTCRPRASTTVCLVKFLLSFSCAAQPWQDNSSAEAGALGLLWLSALLFQAWLTLTALSAAGWVSFNGASTEGGGSFRAKADLFQNPGGLLSPECFPEPDCVGFFIPWCM